MINLPYKESLVAMIFFKDLSYDPLIYATNIKNFGVHYGGFEDRWVWDKKKLLDASVEDLENVYKILYPL